MPEEPLGYAQADAARRAGRDSGSNGTGKGVGIWGPFEDPRFEAWRAWLPGMRDTIIVGTNGVRDGIRYLDDSNREGLITNYSGNRSRESYIEVIEQFRVEEVDRYTPKIIRKITGNGKRNDTYCNIFVWDVTSAMNAEIPHWVSMEISTKGYPVPPMTYENNGGHEQNAGDVVDWLNEFGYMHGWTKIDWHFIDLRPGVDLIRKIEHVAQNKANAGYPVVVVIKHPDGGGHNAVVRPGTYDYDKGVAIAQAGDYILNDAHLVDAYGPYEQNWLEDRGKYQYWLHE